MQSIAFAVELFVVVFCFLCCFFYTSETVNNTFENQVTSSFEEACEGILSIVTDICNVETLGKSDSEAFSVSQVEVKVIKDISTALDSFNDELTVVDTLNEPEEKLFKENNEETLNELVNQLPEVSERLFIQEALQGLSIVQARQIASKLREKNVINQGTKLSGKGIGLKYLVGIISDRLTEHQEVIAEVLNQVTAQAV